MDTNFLCPNCRFYMERTITPYSPESAEMIGLDPDDFRDNGGEMVSHALCLMSGLDLLYDVLECNKYEPEKRGFTPNIPWR